MCNILCPVPGSLAGCIIAKVLCKFTEDMCILVFCTCVRECLCVCIYMCVIMGLFPLQLRNHETLDMLFSLFEPLVSSSVKQGEFYYMGPSRNEIVLGSSVGAVSRLAVVT